MATTQTEQGKGKGAPKGRKEGGQEEVVRLESLAKRVDQLITLKRRCEAATTEFSDAVKVAAEESGLQAKTVRSFIAARAGERFEERKRDVTQLALVFDEIGE